MKPILFPRRTRRPGRGLIAWAFALLVCCGCPVAPVPTGVDGPDQNNTLDTATSLGINATGEKVFSGNIANREDVDVYDLGILATGDRVYVDVRRTSGNLDPVAAIFDSRTYMVAFNDDRQADGSNLNPEIDYVIRGETATYYLAIIAYPGTTTTGDYTVTLRIDRNVGVPAPEAQIVYLDWRGGDVIIPNVGRYRLAAFTATDVGLPASQTAELKDRVQEIVEDRYADYNLIVLNSDDDLEPSVPYTTIYFGGNDPRAFAISQQIDAYNADPSDKAIVFTQSYNGAFSQRPTFEQMAQALGNTVAHELGHLLGLVHTASCSDLMDTTCQNDRILFPQSFSVAALDASVFPFGFQAAQELLGWILGWIGF